MKRRILSFLLAAAVITSVCVVPAQAAPNSLGNFAPKQTYTYGQYKDVPVTSGFSENVKTAYEYGIMQGYGDTFGIQNNITRLASIIIACRINSIYTYGVDQIETNYSGSKQEKYLAYAKDHGIYSVFDDYSFTASRAEFAAILDSSLPEDALYAINTVDLNAIPDVISADHFSDAIYRLYRAGVIVGSDAQGTFHAEEKITRGAAAAIATRMIRQDLRKAITLRLPELPVAHMERKDGIYNYLCYYLWTYHNDNDNTFSYTEQSDTGDEIWTMKQVTDEYGQAKIELWDWYQQGTVEVATCFNITTDLEPYYLTYWVHGNDGTPLVMGFAENIVPYDLNLITDDAFLEFSMYEQYEDAGGRKTDQELAALQLMSSLAFLDRILTAEGDGFSIYDLGFYKAYNDLRR